MESRILGPLEVWDEGGEVSLGGPKPRALLAVLLLHPNEVVPADRLIDELWGEDSPERAAAAILEDHGFEPYRPGPDEVALRNCPFHSLAREAPELVCRMNQAFIDGLLRGALTRSISASVRPGPRRPRHHGDSGERGRRDDRADLAGVDQDRGCRGVEYLLETRIKEF